MLGKAISAARARKRLTLRQLSGLTGIQNSHLSEMETGRRGTNLGWRSVVKLAHVLGLNLNQIAKSEARKNRKCQN